MSIKFKKFIPRPGLVNKQGRLPDPSELVCIEVPKVFDQCLIKRCLTYGAGPDTDTTDCELRSNPLINPKRYISSRNFKITLIDVDKIPIGSSPGFKKIILNYLITFYADFIDYDGLTRSEFFEINRTDIIGKFYCPDSVSQATTSLDDDLCDNNLIKLEMVADVLRGDLLTDKNSDEVLDITLGYYIVVKCELLVQLLIPAYDYCPNIRIACEDEPEEDPCEVFEKAPVPKFYPDQNLEPLFPDCDSSDDNDLN
ncbi:hypothetical protein [uncultured Clostridium sp.]|uniref:hypothetical protein n=1 Tax=uncultured Clostridium sp. TaxID=59620 RepID=UPI00258B10E2|nr:hypothetical protein [uncultured Clostridium sp.]